MYEATISPSQSVSLSVDPIELHCVKMAQLIMQSDAYFSSSGQCARSLASHMQTSLGNLHHAALIPNWFNRS